MKIIKIAAPKPKQYPSYDEFIQFMREHKIYTAQSYQKFRRENPELVKRFPGASVLASKKAYPHFQWSDTRLESWSKRGKDYAPYQEFVKFLKHNDIMTVNEYANFRKTNPTLVQQYPSPWYLVKGYGYPNFNWSDIRPESWKQKPKKVFASYPEFVKFMQENGIVSALQYMEFRRLRPELVENFPSSSAIHKGLVYPEFDWKDIRGKDWRIKSKSLSEFVDFITKNDIVTSQQWQEYIKEHGQQDGFPHRPDKTYYGFNWNDFNPERWARKRKAQYDPQSEFIEFVKENDIMSELDWIKFQKKNGTIDRFPYHPNRIYPEFRWADVRPLGWDPYSKWMGLEQYDKNPDYIKKELDDLESK